MSWVFFNHSHAPNLTRNEICAEVLRSTPKFEGYSEGYFVHQSYVTSFLELSDSSIHSPILTRVIDNLDSNSLLCDAICLEKAVQFLSI